jgi:hypothetical protein
MRMPSSVLCVAAIACVLMIGVSGCGRDAPIEPTPALDGAWRGTITRGATAGTITLLLTQSGAGVTGTWTADLDGLAFDQTGSTGGTVTGSTVSLFLTPETPLTCASGATLSGTLAMNGSLVGGRLTGDYVMFACDSVATGRIEVTRD